MQRSFLKQCRLKKGLRLEDASRLIGISLPFLSHIETGRHDPSLEMAIKLEKFYGIPITTLLKRDSEE